jgi:hypothetical protein
MNLSFAVFEEDVCVSYRKDTDFVTSRVYYDPSGFKNLDIVYQPDELGHFIIVNFRKAGKDIASQPSVEFREQQYGLWFQPPMTASIYSIVVEDTPFMTEKKNLISHTYFSRFESLWSWVLHFSFFYAMVYHTRETRSYWPKFRPFRCYLAAYLGLRTVGWADGLTFFIFNAQTAWLWNWSYILLPAMFVYYFEINSRGKLLLKVLLPAYFVVGLVDYTIMLFFITKGLGVVGVAYFLFLVSLPWLTTDVITDPTEWVFSLTFALQLFVQHIFWQPFKKTGAMKLYLANLTAYFLSYEFAFFGVGMIVFLVPVALLRYKIARLRTAANAKYHQRKRMDSRPSLTSDLHGWKSAVHSQDFSN